MEIDAGRAMAGHQQRRDVARLAGADVEHVERPARCVAQEDLDRAAHRGLAVGVARVAFGERAREHEVVAIGRRRGLCLERLGAHGGRHSTRRATR